MSTRWRACSGARCWRRSGCARRRPVDLLQHACRTRRQEDVQALHRRAAAHQVGGVLQGTVRRARAGAAYLSRYTHRVAISNRRLVAADDAGIAFRWGLSHQRPGPLEDNAASPARVHQAFLLHVLPKGFHRIRHYGLFANANRAKSIATARALPMSPRLPPTRKAARVAPDAPRVPPAMPALWRPHDCDRGVRVRLRAEVAADAEQDRHAMSHTSCERCGFPVPMRWRRAGADLLDPITSINAPSGRRCAPSPRRGAYRMLPTSPARRHAARILPGSRPPSRSAPASIPIALAAQPVPNFPRLRALALLDAGPLSVRKSSCYCRRPKTCTKADIMARRLERNSLLTSARAHHLSNGLAFLAMFDGGFG